MRCTLTCLMLMGSVGCQMPQIRVFQKKAPEAIVKSVEAKEVDRQAADLIAREIVEPKALQPVAIKLSESLGVPEQPLTGNVETESDVAVAALVDELVKTQKKREELNIALLKIDGKKIEGTGYDVFGFSMSLSLIALVVLFVMFPPLATLAWWLFQRVSGALSRTAKGVSAYVKEHPDQGDKLKSYLQAAQDRADRNIISKIKSKL